jgi:type IV pilus assembly protein PilC
MVGAGVPLAQCLDILIDQTENATLSKATADIKAEVEGGGSLSEALGKYPKIFDNLYVNMIRAGEASGQLEPIFNQLADLLERQRDLRNRVKSALFLPIMVMGFCVLITIALIVFVVPRFANIFEMMNAPLPGPTQMLINISRDIRGPKGLIAIVAISLLAFAIRKVIKTEQGGRIWDQIKLKLPLFGSLIMKKIVANFARTYGLLDRSGVPILESLDIVAQTAGNRIVSRSIMEARSGVQEGEDLSKRLEQSRIFPPMVTQMIVVGEKTGTVETMLFKIAELYEADVERTVEGLTKLIEPMMMILVGVLVGSILICMYLPIFNMAGLMSGGV